MILMYHHVCPASEIPAQPPPGEGWQYTISPEALETQLRALMDGGFRFTSLESMVATIQTRGYVLGRVAAITLDDGWVDNYRYAFPVFQKLGLPATFFMTTDHLHRRTGDERKMTAVHAREVCGHGMSVGGHTRSHPNLARIPAPQAKEEIAGCKADLEDALGGPVSLFAYPGGQFNPAVARIVEEAGYTAACSVMGMGINSRASRYWLYRDTLTEKMDTLADTFRIHPALRLLMLPRTWRRTRQMLRA